jgi:hypothetical protein
MLDRPERGGITLPPGLDRRKLSLNGFVAYGRVKVLGATISRAMPEGEEADQVLDCALPSAIALIASR